jgi:hypothetical protein
LEQLVSTTSVTGFIPNLNQRSVNLEVLKVYSALVALEVSMVLAALEAFQTWARLLATLSAQKHPSRLNNCNQHFQAMM